MKTILAAIYGQRILHYVYAPMFTGLIEERGRLSGRIPRGPGARMRIQCAMAPLVLGESISVDGACLTVDAIVDGGFEADVSKETLDRTTLGGLAVGAPVNLERATPLGGRMGGHIVGGHVDAVGTVVQKKPVGHTLELHVAFPHELAPFIAQKGSIAINGVSLTVNGVGDARFDVVLIPHTRGATALDLLPVGARVNLEADVLARYVARQLRMATAPLKEGTGPSGDGPWLERLTRAGYL